MPESVELDETAPIEAGTLTPEMLERAARWAKAEWAWSEWLLSDITAADIRRLLLAALGECNGVGRIAPPKKPKTKRATKGA